MKATEKVTLFVMNYKGFKVLEALIAISSGFIHEVISSRDKNVNNDYFTDIKSLCKKHKIKFTIRSSASDFKTKYAFSVAWRWLIPVKEEKKLIIFHDSLLPRYRGFAPLVNALINNEKKVGVTALFASEKYDEGEIIAQSVYNISYPVKINTLIEEVTNNYIDLATGIAKKIIAAKKLTSQKQDEKKSSYSIWRDEDDYEIDWNMDARDVVRFINAVGNPYKGAKSILENNTVRITDAELYKDVKLELTHVGKILFRENGLPIVVCGKGLIKITEMSDDITGQSLLPLQKFRLRFKKSF